jgi:hypothetical protein
MSPSSSDSSPSASYIVSSAVSSAQGSSNARPQSQQAAQELASEPPPSPPQTPQVQHYSQPQEQQTETEPQEQQTAQAFPAELPTQQTQQVQQNQVATKTKTTTITSAIELSGIPSVIPPYGSMERMALLNLLVHRIKSSITSISQEKVLEITILSIGQTSMLSRLLRSADSGERSLGDYSKQLVKYTAVLEYDCAQEEEALCAKNAQSSADGIVQQLSPTEPLIAPPSPNDSVDNEGEDWTSITNAKDNQPMPSTQSFVWLPSPSSNVDLQVITSRPTPYPTPNPSSSPPTESTDPQAFQIDTQITSSNPLTENKFEGDASKRYCGYDWNDVVQNCL